MGKPLSIICVHGKIFFCGRFKLLRFEKMMQPVMTATQGSSPDGFGSALGTTVAHFRV